MEAERIAEIRKIRNCVPFVDVDCPESVAATQQAIDDLLARVSALESKLTKVAGWLDARAEQSKAQSKAYERFTSLSDACAADAKNYAATAKDIREALRETL